MRLGNAPVRRLPEPERRFEKILLRARTVGIHVAHVELRGCESLLRRLQVKFECIGQVRRHAAAELVHHAKVEIRRRQPAIGGPLIQRDGFRQILRRPRLVRVGVPQCVERFRIALVGPRANRADAGRPRVSEADRPNATNAVARTARYFLNSRKNLCDPPRLDTVLTCGENPRRKQGGVLHSVYDLFVRRTESRQRTRQVGLALKHEIIRT